MVLPPMDFKSIASADSAIAPWRSSAMRVILPYFEMLSNWRHYRATKNICFPNLSLQNTDIYARKSRLELKSKFDQKCIF